MMASRLRVVLVFAVIAIWLLVMAPFQLIALGLVKLGWRMPAGVIPVIFHRVLLRIFGIRLRVDGKLSKVRPLLIVSNHMSWLDIVVLGAVQPLSFVAKSDMRSWPLFGQLARMQRTIFIERQDRRTTGAQANAIAERMAERDAMVLFPEGTTSDGNMLLPFKTPLFEAAKLALADDDSMDIAVVQPCAVHYVRIHGLPIGRADRPDVAWPGNVGLGESVVGIARIGALDVTVRAGEPITLTKDSNRKVVAAQASKALREMLQ